MVRTIAKVATIRMIEMINMRNTIKTIKMSKTITITAKIMIPRSEDSSQR